MHNLSGTCFIAVTLAVWGLLSGGVHGWEMDAVQEVGRSVEFNAGAVPMVPGDLPSNHRVASLAALQTATPSNSTTGSVVVDKRASAIASTVLYGLVMLGALMLLVYDWCFRNTSVPLYKQLKSMNPSATPVRPADDRGVRVALYCGSFSLSVLIVARVCAHLLEGKCSHRSLHAALGCVGFVAALALLIALTAAHVLMSRKSIADHGRAVTDSRAFNHDLRVWGCVGVVCAIVLAIPFGLSNADAPTMGLLLGIPDLLAMFALFLTTREVWQYISLNEVPFPHQHLWTLCLTLVTFGTFWRLIIDGVELYVLSVATEAECDGVGFPEFLETAMGPVVEVTLVLIPAITFVHSAGNSDTLRTQRSGMRLIRWAIQLGWLLFVLAILFFNVTLIAHMRDDHGKTWLKREAVFYGFVLARAGAAWATLHAVIALLGMHRLLWQALSSRGLGPIFAAHHHPLHMHIIAGVLTLASGLIHVVGHYIVLYHIDHNDPTVPKPYQGTPADFASTFPGYTGYIMLSALTLIAMSGTCFRACNAKRLLSHTGVYVLHFTGIVIFLDVYVFHGTSTAFGVFPYNGVVMLGFISISGEAWCVVWLLLVVAVDRWWPRF